MEKVVKNKPSHRYLNFFLNAVETVGNFLPDPAILFVIGLCIVWVLSSILSTISFDAIDPRTGQVLQIKNLLSPASLTDFVSRMVTIFTSFPPLGVVLVMMIGVGVLEQSGFMHAAIRKLLSSTSKHFLTPIICLAGLLSHVATDAGYVLLIPLGGLIFHAAGRHPLAGIAAAFAGVAGGFCANLIPGPIDPLLQSFTQSAAQMIDPKVMVNPLCNYYFTIASSLLIIAMTWIITDYFVEVRLAKIAYGDHADESKKDEKEALTSKLSEKDSKAFRFSTMAFIGAIGIFVLLLYPATSPFRGPSGNLTDPQAPLMKAIVPIFFLMFVAIGTLFGYIAGAFKSAKDVIQAMVKTMQGMGHYIVMVFFCALFVDAFSTSNLGIMLSIKGAQFLKGLALPPVFTIQGIIFLCAFVNLFVGSASAKWAIIAPIFVTMLMQLGISPELAQAAYRIGDSSTNIITPLNPYFPLIVVYCQRFVPDTRIGTVVAMMMPYALAFLIGWSLFLMVYWGLGLPLGINAGYTYTPM